MGVSFKNRIAFHYMVATAIIMAVAFGAIYFLVQETVLRNLDNDLSYEAERHSGEINIIGDSIQFNNKAEWEEREHREIQVNPIFIQLIDKKGRLMDKSPNLKDELLPFKEIEFGGHFSTQLNNRSIRQAQLPIEQDGKIKGYILTAISSESAQSVILKLRNVLLISYFTVLAGLYFISRFLAGRSIRPVQEVTNTIVRITKNNLKERVHLPSNKDDIYNLSTNFNELIERIENAMERERQFTSDASHELRTPLASLRGTLEVLIRKPRTQQEYEEKVKFSLKEIERMTSILEQLLLLARLDTNQPSNHQKLVSLPAIIDESLTHLRGLIKEKELKIDFQFDRDKKFLVPHYYTTLMIDNIINNSIKYSNKDSAIKIEIVESTSGIVCSIEDEGIGIKEEDLSHIYKNFFRSDYLNHKNISGNGLGLFIVKKCADAIQAKLVINSTLDKGTVVTITFNQTNNGKNHS
uniref:sensor histidine kinase n=1 Tax=Fulvivirga sp. TaxID=1931237 RepID=UPI00404B5DC3